MKRISFLLALILASPVVWAAEGDVVINEVAWMGTTDSYSDEWIELYNNTADAIDLDGWYLVDDEGLGNETVLLFEATDCGGAPDCYLCTNNDCTIAAGGYFLIEVDENAIADVASNLVIPDLQLANSGDSLTLRDTADELVDFLDTASETNHWYAGDNDDDLSMERIDPKVPGFFALNWGNNDPATAQNGTDAGGNAINGTPGQPNSLLGNPIPGPAIVNVHCVDATAVDVFFNVQLDQTSAEVATNYVLNAGDGDINPGTAALDPSDTTMVHLTGISGITEEDLTTITATGVLDVYQAGEPSDTFADFYFGILAMGFVRYDGDDNGLPDIYDNTPDAFVTVEGIVTSVEDFDYRQTVFQDATGGLLIHDQLTTANMTRGDRVRVSGVLDHYNHFEQLQDTRYAIISAGNDVQPVIMTLADLAANPEPYESVLMGIEDVSNTGAGDAWPAAGDSANVEISDDAGTTTYVLRIDQDTDIDGMVEPTWPVIVIGVGGQYSTTYQFLPRDQNDIDVDPGTWPPEGATRPCYSPGDDTYLNPPCQVGYETYSSGSWGSCEGEVTPEAADDSCDFIDNDCDGTTDEDADTSSDANNCGECGNVCNLANVESQECVGGVCQIVQCLPTHADCDVDHSTGCETALGTLTDCTDCDDSCIFDHAANSTCEQDGCNMVCDDGWADCGGGTDDGCETELWTDQNCSACGDDCSQAFANATGSCSADSHVCVFVECLENFGDCDNNTANGCEIALTSTDNCGSCGNTCEENETCIDTGSGYECSSTCQDADDDGFADESCGGNDCDDSDEFVFPGADELCDGVDNDCDDETDEDFLGDENNPGLGDACDSENDADLCENGTLVCNETLDGLVCEGDFATPEACSGEDDDCDGETDEDWPELGDACDGPDEDECEEGTLVCNEAGNGTTCEEIGAGHQELCNNEDDDCDGETDEGFGTYTCGHGVCEVTVDVCVDGELQECVRDETSPDYEPGSELTCDDGLDNDCDGITDMQDLDCSSGGDDGGCGCSSARSHSSGALASLLLGLALVFGRRRRKK